MINFPIPHSYHSKQPKKILNFIPEKGFIILIPPISSLILFSSFLFVMNASEKIVGIGESIGELKACSINKEINNS